MCFCMISSCFCLLLIYLFIIFGLEILAFNRLGMQPLSLISTGFHFILSMNLLQLKVEIFLLFFLILYLIFILYPPYSFPSILSSYFLPPFIAFLKIIYFLCMNVLPVCMYMYMCVPGVHAGGRGHWILWDRSVGILWKSSKFP